MFEVKVFVEYELPALKLCACSFQFDNKEQAHNFVRRIVAEGIWVDHPSGECFYPPTQILKAQVNEITEGGV